MTHPAIDDEELLAARKRRIVSLDRVFWRTHAWNGNRPLNWDRMFGRRKRVFHRTVGWLDFHETRPVNLDDIEGKQHHNPKEQAHHGKDGCKSSQNNAQTCAHK